MNIESTIGCRTRIEDAEAVIRWLESLPDELDLSFGGPRICVSERFGSGEEI